MRGLVTTISSFDRHEKLCLRFVDGDAIDPMRSGQYALRTDIAVGAVGKHDKLVPRVTTRSTP